MPSRVRRIALRSDSSQFRPKPESRRLTFILLIVKDIELLLTEFHFSSLLSFLNLHDGLRTKFNSYLPFVACVVRTELEL